MKHTSPLATRHATVAAVSATIIMATVITLAVFLIRQPLAQTLPAARQNQTAPETNPQLPEGVKAGTPIPDTAEIVHARDFGTWDYQAVRSDEGFRIIVNYNHTSVNDLKTYAAANKALLAELAPTTGQIEVAITFVPPLQPEQFRTWAKTNGLQVREAQLRVGAPGGTQGTIGIGGTENDPLPQTSIEKFSYHSMGGVFGVYGKVGAEQLIKIAADPHVFVVDVTPTWVRRDLAQAGITDAEQARVFVDLPFGWMEELGLQNFTQLLLPTVIPSPVGTVQPAYTVLPAP